MTASEDNAPSVIDRAAETISNAMNRMNADGLRWTPRQFAVELFDAGQLRTGRHAEVLRQLDRAESRYNTLREALGDLREFWRTNAEGTVTDDYDAGWDGALNKCADELSALLSKDGNDGT